MDLSNDTILEDIDQVMKAITTVSTLSTSILQPQYFNQYIRDATSPRTILSDARMVVMNAQVQNIDRTNLSGRVLEIVAENTAITNYATQVFHQRLLTAKEYVAMIGISDNALRRTLEGQGFESTMVSMFSEQAGIDWEEQAVFADPVISAYDTVMKGQKGWLAHVYDDANAQMLFDGGAGSGFDVSVDGNMGMFDAMINAIPKPYLKPQSQKFYCAWTEYDGYRNELASRETGLGDAILTTDTPLRYKGFQVVYAPVLDSTEGVDHTGRPCILVDPNNLVYGVFKNITVEPDRVPKRRATDFVLGMEVDQNLENPNAIAIAFPAETSYPSS